MTLTDYGLQEIGSWELSKSHASVAHLSHLPGINYDIPRDVKTIRDVVYAFLVDGVVCYVGETSPGLESRFSCYRYGQELVNDTDNRVKAEITNALVSNKSVSIWFAQPMATLHTPVEDLELPASKLLEEHLIAKLSPAWNVKNLQGSRQ